jgi:preprotein translocase subunit SecG
MLFLFGTIIILASIILGVIILIQNPKGGGLTSSFGGFGNQLMGVRQTTDILEKGTWIFAGLIGALCIASTLFIPSAGGVNSRDNLINEAPVGTPLAPKNNTVPLQSNPQPQVPAQQP